VAIDEQSLNHKHTMFMMAPVYKGKSVFRQRKVKTRRAHRQRCWTN